MPLRVISPETESQDVIINCPECGEATVFPGKCSRGHEAQSIDGIPICIPAHRLEGKESADPNWPFPYAMTVARNVAPARTAAEAIDLFFSICEQERSADLSAEKALVTARRISQVSEAISEASRLLAKRGKRFPMPHRTHIEVGAGIGFDLAASSQSWFGSNFIGLDLSPHYLVMAKKLLAENGVTNPRLVCADITDGWPIPLSEYDIGFISMEGVLEHIKNVDAFFRQVCSIRSYPYCLYLTVPYRWTLHPESHFRLRGVGWLPTRWLQDAYVKARLGAKKLDHVEQYSVKSLQKLLRRYFKPDAITIIKNSDDPRKARYLMASVFVEQPSDLI